MKMVLREYRNNTKDRKMQKRQEAFGRQGCPPDKTSSGKSFCLAIFSSKVRMQNW